MTFVVAAPEMVSAAAGNLAGIRSALGEAITAAAGPTTGVTTAGADEVSMAISALFGAHGQEFQALSAEAAAFHDNFVGLLKSGASAYLGTEAANVQQILGGAAPVAVMGSVGQNFGAAAAAVTGQVQAEAQAMVNAIPGASAAIQGLNSFGATVAAPYQALNSNTMANLQAANSTFQANPAPFLHQLISNQTGYGQLTAPSLQNTVTNLPTVLANVPANIQAAFQSLLSANPGAFLHQIVTNQIGFAQTITTALHSAAQDSTTGLQALPASLQAAGQDLLAGNMTGAVDNLESGCVNLFITGFSSSFHVDPLTYDIGIVTITPTGVLGDLLPILGIPGQMAQNFTNFIPPSIAHQVAQNFTNLLTTVTSTSTTANMLAPNGAIPLSLGLPLTLGIDLIGSPVTTTYAIGASASAFINAVQTGNLSGALASLLDAPAVVANGFLNGQATLNLPYLAIEPNMGSLTSLPLGGILTPLNYGSITGIIPGFGPLPFPTDGTTFGGTLPGLLNYLPQQLAQAIGAPPMDVF